MPIELIASYGPSRRRGSLEADVDEVREAGFRDPLRGEIRLACEIVTPTACTP